MDRGDDFEEAGGFLLEAEEALLGKEVACVWVKVRLALDAGSQRC